MRRVCDKMLKILYSKVFLFGMCVIIILLSYLIINNKPKIEYVETIKEVTVIEYVDVPVIEYVEIPVVEYVEVQKKYYNVTAYERDILAKTVYLEARGESDEAQKAVCSVIFNRVLHGYGTIDSICHDKNQFSVAPKVDGAKPTEHTYKLVDEVIENGSTIPTDVIFFRDSFYHSWAKNWKKIDSLYFSKIKR